MINHNLRTYKSAVSVIFYYYMPQNKQAQRHSLCSVMSHVVLFAYPIKLNIWIRTQLQKFYQRSYIVNLTHLSNAIKKIVDKISFHRHFKAGLQVPLAFLILAYVIEFGCKDITF